MTFLPVLSAVFSPGLPLLSDGLVPSFSTLVNRSLSLLSIFDRPSFDIPFSLSSLPVPATLSYQLELEACR